MGDTVLSPREARAECCQVCDGHGRMLAGNSVWPCTNCSGTGKVVITRFEHKSGIGYEELDKHGRPSPGPGLYLCPWCREWGVMMADTEDWRRPLCVSCAEPALEPEK
jgi:RecJ-like exonuclease